MPHLDLLAIGLRHLEHDDQGWLALSHDYSWNKMLKIWPYVGTLEHQRNMAMWLYDCTSLVFEYDGCADVTDIIQTIKVIGLEYMGQIKPKARTNPEAYRVFSNANVFFA